MLLQNILFYRKYQSSISLKNYKILYHVQLQHKHHRATSASLTNVIQSPHSHIIRSNPFLTCCCILRCVKDLHDEFMRHIWKRERQTLGTRLKCVDPFKRYSHAHRIHYRVNNNNQRRASAYRNTHSK